jgi:serine protease Do
MSPVRGRSRLFTSLQPLVRRWCALVGLLLLAGASVPDVAAQEREDGASVRVMARQLVPRIVRVQARAADGRLNFGSGVPIAPDLIATNCHVTRNADAVLVAANGADGPREHPVVAQAGSTSQDICVLRLAQRLRLPPVRLGAPPSVGEAVLAIGFTGGLFVRVHSGVVLERHRHDGADVLETSTAFDHGASGGGLFTTAGDLVGLVTFRSYGDAPRFFVTPVQWIVQILETQPFEPIAPLRGQPFWQAAEAQLPEFLRSPHARPAPTARGTQPSQASNAADY